VLLAVASGCFLCIGLLTPVASTLVALCSLAIALFWFHTANGSLFETILAVAETCSWQQIIHILEDQCLSSQQPSVGLFEAKVSHIAFREEVMKSLVWFITGASRGFGVHIARAALGPVWLGTTSIRAFDASEGTV
jgi:hypothetical protein